INSLGTMIGPLIVAFALFGSSASITDDMIAKLDLVKVIVLYLVVGILFILAATIFGISKSVPSGKHEEPMAPANKALRSLLVMTGLLIIMFTPVFSSYNSDEAKTIVVKEKTVELLKSQNDNHAEIALLTQEIKNLKKPLEQERMIWLSGALVSVLSVLLFANRAATKQAEGWGAMRYPQLVLGMLAIFIYVGVEVAIGSNLGELLKQKSFGGLEASAIAPYISMYWGSLMIGRWAGAVNAFELKKSTKLGLIFFVPLIAFAFIIAANLLAQKDVSNLYWYVLCVLIQVAAFFYVGENPIKSLLVFGGLGIVAMTVGMLSDGPIAIYAFLSGGLCCSILWPCIFSLSITGLGKYTSQGSAFLIMMILGGGIIPPLQGKLADVIGIQSSYIIAIFCFAYLAFFGWQVKRILNQQGITHFDAAGSGH
ncbi:MAG: MFS transporter, partial [Flavobacteriales bacterium]